MYSIAELLEQITELQYIIKDDNIKIVLEIYINKLIMINSDSISVQNILYLAHIESDINKIKRYVEGN